MAYLRITDKVRKCLPSSGPVYGVGSLVTKKQNPLELAQEGIYVVINPISKKKKKKKSIKNLLPVKIYWKHSL